MSLEPVVLSPAAPSDAVLLSNLLERYIHDLSDVFTHLEIGAEGRFGYPKLPLYFSEPDRRFAYLIRRGPHTAGFALVTRGSPVVTTPDVHDVAEFFVLKQYRRAGLGRRAATLLWQQFPGNWTVRVSEGNPAALAFWRRAVTEFTRGTATESVRPGSPHAWRVLFFASPEGDCASP